MFKLNRKWNTALQILIVVVVYFGIQAYHKRGTTRGTAPPLYGNLLDGTVVGPESFKGKPYLVHFWAAWCSICRLEQGSINAIAEDYPVLTIASQSGSKSEVAKFVKEHELNFPVLVDNSGQWAKAFGVLAYPTSFFVDSVGEIRFVEVGYTTELGLRARMSLSQ